MSLKEFESGLDSLFRQYTDALRRDVGKSSRGPAPKLDRRKVAPRIQRLVELATDLELRKVGKLGFNESITKKKQWHAKRGKGRGLDAKKKNFRDWYQSNVQSHNCVYAFWRKRKCLYVGRTGAGGCRPHAHFEKFWFSGVTRIDTFVINGKRKLPMSECLAIHMFSPKHNKVKSARQKYRSSCPVCSKELKVRKKLLALFPLKRSENESKWI